MCGWVGVGWVGVEWVGQGGIIIVLFPEGFQTGLIARSYSRLTDDDGDIDDAPYYWIHNDNNTDMVGFLLKDWSRSLCW